MYINNQPNNSRTTSMYVSYISQESPNVLRDMRTDGTEEQCLDLLGQGRDSRSEI